jgi:polar amino acid transport system permease protein
MDPVILQDLLEGGEYTLLIAAGAWLFAAVFGLLLAILRDLGSRPISLPVVGVVTILRSLPELIILYLVFFGLGSTGLQLSAVVAAIIALGITDGAFISEYYRASFLNIPATQREAGASLGLSRLKVMRLVVLPQTIPFVMPPLLNSFVALLKSATLASAIGAMEILARAQNEMNLTGQIANVLGIVIVIYIVITFPLTRVVARLERRVHQRVA